LSALRKEIRKFLVGVLKGRTRAGNNVRENRSEVNWQENLPAINLYFRSEEIEELNESPRTLRRRLAMDVEIIDDGRDGEELSDKLDDLAEQVETCLALDDSIGGCADDIIQTGVTEIEADSSGEKPTGTVRLLYRIDYHTDAPRGQPRLGDLDTIGAQWQVGHNDEAPTMDEDDRAKDEITINP
jgi:hypothetical protein